MTGELFRQSARCVRKLLRRGEISPTELVECAIRRIEAVDDMVNAIPTRCFERAREQAEQLTRSVARGEQAPFLGGIPLVIKDNCDVGGVRTTSGTPIFADRIAERSDRAIAAMEANGGIPIGKSNLSELGGASTSNAVLGTTLNPWNTRLSCGGSSGGSAVALATGQVWLAHGNDVGGSLRIPASFCGVAGLRPSLGRVPRRSQINPFDTTYVDGPMARDVGDLALLFDAMVAYDANDPLSAPSPDGPFLRCALEPLRPERIAYSPDLGCLPTAPEVHALGESFAATLEKNRVAIHRTSPDFAGALSALLSLRGASYATAWEPFLAEHRHAFTRDVLADITSGQTQSASTLAAAERYRADLYRRVLAFLTEHEFLITPSVTTLPDPAEIAWPREIDGTAQKTYMDWIAITSITSLLACPILAVPVGFSRNGLPFGVQIIGRPRSEPRLFQIAAWIERLLDLPPTIIEPRSGL
jgi:amidase